MFDWIIVGAGFTGATLAERIATLRNEKVLVIDRRQHIAGNAYDRMNEAGILVHKFGPHIFHTNSQQVWNYLQRFSEWRPYFHKVLAVIDGKEVPIPFNLNTMEAVFPRQLADRYSQLLLERYTYGERVPILKMMRETNADLKALATFIYEKVFKNYTIKQWELTPEQLSPSVTARVPILISRDDRYFQDRYQAMPAAGYSAMFERMLDHPNIKVMLNADYREVKHLFPSARTVYSGPIDEFFDYKFGPLPYRSMKFVEKTVDAANVQSVGTINFPAEHDFTRVTELKHLTGQTTSRTTLLYEYPRQHVPGETEPYYPIPRDETQLLLNKYLDLAKDREDVIFCGRLGDYKYYNMDQAVGAALTVFSKKIMGGNPDV